MSIIIGIDHGYYAIKTAHCSFPAGLTSYGEHEPYTRQGLLEFGGCFFVCGSGRQPIQRDKTINDNYYLLTLAAIAKEIRQRGLPPECSVRIAAGLPLTSFGRDKPKFKDYLLRSNQPLNYKFEGVEYSITIEEVAVFPQGYAALMTEVGLAMGKVFTNGGLKQPLGELCAVDYQRQSPVFHFFLHGITPPFHEFCRDGSKTKVGPPAAAEDSGSSYHQQDAVPQLGKIQLALGRYQRIGAGMPMVAVVLDAEQAVVGGFCIRQYMVSTIISQSGSSGMSSVTLPQELIDAINNVGFWDSIPLWAVTLIGGLLITVLSFTMILTVYGRMFSLWMYAAIAPIPLSKFAGEPTSSVGKNFIRSYAGVCLQGVVIALSCIIFSAISSSPPAVDTGASVVTAVWTYVGELAFNLLVLVGAIKGCDRIVKEIMGL